jgi:hypothetical protein
LRRSTRIKHAGSCRQEIEAAQKSSQRAQILTIGTAGKRVIFARERKHLAREGKTREVGAGSLMKIHAPMILKFTSLLKRSLGTALAAFSLAISAHAHSVWIEDLDGKLVVRFGEPGDEPEKSPGRLDSLTTVTGWTPGAPQPKAVVVSKKADHFLLGEAAVGEAAQIETGFGVRKSGDKPARRPFFYARWQPAGNSAATPALNLDLVPTGPGEVKVYFRGQALPGAKLVLRAPKGAEKELAADEKGIVKLGETKEEGLYLLTCAGHSENVPGFFGGLAYEVASHNASLTWRVGK